MKKFVLKTIFIRGGTPTSWSLDQIRRLGEIIDEFSKDTGL